MRVATSLTANILERISTLYGIEAEVRGKPPDVRLAARQSRKEADGRCVMQAVDAALRQLSPSLTWKIIVCGTKL
jgi:hypothetical protein